MNNTELRESLLSQADSAFFQLVEQVNLLLDRTEFYINRRPAFSASDKLKLAQLSIAIASLGKLPDQLAREVERWKKDEDRVISVMGIELEVLNELFATCEATMLFLIRADVPLQGFSLNTVRQAHNELLRCNRLL